MQLGEDGVSSPENAKRLFETDRKRKYRANKLNELIELEAQSRRLGAYLAQLQAKNRARQLARSKGENKTLRFQVNQSQCLMQMLSLWAQINERPQRALSHQTTWIETTLLTHPITRRQGIEWLSERVYHQACRVLPLNYPNRGRVDDDIGLDVLRSDDLDEDGVTISALKTHYRFSTCANYKSAAQVHWSDLIGAVSAFTNELIDRVDDRFLYYYHTNHRLGTSTLTIAGLFQDKDKVVVTNCFVAKDELFPLSENGLRPHGFNWTVYEAITPDLTLVHNLAVQYTPITAKGKLIPLEKIGQLFGRSAEGVQYRETYIEQIRNAAEASFVSLNKPMIKRLSDRMEKTASLEQDLSI
ncbi:unnamed protein product [Aphanomyces euteiches]|nr:hypothetical protein AeRB84_004631 [Aphanomyces euteiches]